MAQRDARPPFAAIDGAVPPEFSALPTPCYLLDEAALTHNAEILGGLARRTGCKVLLAQKAFSNYNLYPLLAPHLAGTEASGLFEARLGAEEMPGKEVHVFCAAYRADEMDELLLYADHIVFNSPAQLAKFGPAAKAAGKRLHISGIGKPAHLAGYAASLFSSTGTPAYFLHGTEAVHGSCGQLVPGDVVIFISNSGETAEMKATVSAVKNNGCAVIGVSGNASSWLAQQSEVHLLAHADAEGGPLDRAPRASILAETLVLQALSVLLQSEAKVTPQQYVKWHPGGSLGHLRENER